MREVSNYIFLFLFPVFLFSQNQTTRFVHLTMKDGLADNYAHSIFTDSKGYLWFATQGGLSRYDGSSFTNFKEDIEDPSSVTARVAMSIAEDNDGYLWIAMYGGGLNRYDPQTETFRTFRLQFNDGSYHLNQTASKILIDDGGMIWVGSTDVGLFLFDSNQEKFVNHYDLMPYDREASEGFLKNSVNDIVEDMDNPNILWMSGNNGLFRFDKATEQIKYLPISYNQQVDSTASFRHMYMEKAGELWIGVHGHGLVRYFTNTNTWEVYPHQAVAYRRNNRSANQTNTVCPKRENELWVATKDKGLLAFNTTSKTYVNYQHDNSNPESILSNDTEYVYRDPQDRIWIATAKSGVSMIDPSLQTFDFVELPPSSACPTIKNSEASIAILNKTQNKLIVTTQGCGSIIVYDKLNDTSPSFDFQLNVSQDINAKLTVLEDAQDRIWVAGILPSNTKHRSISVLDIKNQRLIPFEHSAMEQIPYDDFFMTDMLEDRNGNIWFVTWNAGLLKLETASNSLKHFIQSDEHPDYFRPDVAMNEIIEDRNGMLWIAAHDEGVYRFDPNTETLESYTKDRPGLDELFVMHITEDRHGWIWAEDFKKGIKVFNPNSTDTTEVKRIDLYNGLPSRSITEVLTDQEGNVWFNSFDGIYRYDEALNTFVGFDESNTRTPNVFHKGFNLLSSGEIVVGKTMGFNLFHPAKVHKNEIPPPVVVTDFKVHDTLHRLHKSVNYLEEITLPYRDNFFSIGFAALNYSQSEKNRYAYQLEGYDENWIYPSDNRQVANYTRVKEGDYTFKVKAANNDGVWNEAGKQIKIKVLPPWWRSTLAYIVYVVSTIFILYSLYRFLLNRRMAAEETRRLKEMDALKTKLYTNITHEFRTPLTVIQGMAEQMEGDPIAKNLIRRNSKNLLRLVTQMLDMSRLESGKLKLKIIRQDIIPYLRYLTASFESYAMTKNINIQFTSSLDNYDMNYDAEKVQHILANLISNALKFTPQNGKVNVSVNNGVKHKDQDHASVLQIKVQDTGIGIAQRDIPHIFDRFYQVDGSSTRQSAGSGIGLALAKELAELMNGTLTVKSEIAKGTEFSFLLPNQFVEATELIDADHVAPIIYDQEEVFIPPPEEIDEVGDYVSTEQPLLLLIEDNPDVVFYIKTCLEDRYDIQVAENGQLGITKALEIIPDIIISDVMMPLKDGFEVTDILKQDERTSHIPIILLTAKADVDSKIEGLERGADAYLIKPFNKRELLIRLEKLIEIRQKIQSRYSNLAPLSPTKDKAIQIEDAFLIKVRTTIEANLADGHYTVPQLCKDIGLSQSQLYRKIKALTNKSISAFMATIRLQKGKDLLEHTELSISEIAYEVGFTDPAYFSKTFSKVYGYPPSENRS